jgi:GT2 family glycosyltransferase
MTADPGLTVVVPTVGREELLLRCLRSIAACSGPAPEVVVVDQGPAGAVERVLARAGLPRARRLPSPRRGIATALNLALEHVGTDAVAVTHDDCTVATDWVETAARLAGDPERIVTGRVLPGGEGHVPSVKTAEQREEYTGPEAGGVLYPNNMVIGAAGVRALGGFDERFTTAAEDNDLCYRWLRAGRRIAYEPALVVWHHDWRSPAQLRRLYRRYWYAQGVFYGKHLRRGDGTVARLMRWDLQAGATAVREGRRGSAPPVWADPRRGVFAGLPAGVARGLLLRPSRRWA